jgi:ABC-2 type transport system permease protein
MLSLLKKEISQFFTTIIGYFVIVIFLLANGLTLWFFSSQFNIPENGYATLDVYFALSPWIFLFLVPAITMRMFSEEIRMGTLETLLTRPLSEMQVILAKYFASVILVLASLIPTLIYFISVYFLGNPMGNIDIGGTWGSFIGLFFLAAIYAAAGIFSSSLSGNQIVALIIAVIISLVLFTGFDQLSSMPAFSNYEHVIASLGINEHYKSISRGVIDFGDVIYFIGVAAIFILLTRTVLQSRKW